MSLRPGAVARRTAANATRLARRVAGRSLLPREGASWIRLRLGAPVPELELPHLPFGRAPVTTLLETLRCLERAATDARIAGVVLRFTGPMGGLARCLSLRRAVDALRSAGKPVVAWGESFDAASYAAAAGATRVYLPASGSLYLVGLRFESLHWKGLLDRLDVKPDVVRIGAYKTAGERFTRSALSQEAREQLEELADDLYARLVDAIASARGLDATAVRERIDAGPYAASAAVDAGLVDGCRYPDEVEPELFELAPRTAKEGRDDRPRLIDARDYHALCVADAGWRPLHRELPHLAYVAACGMIHRGGGPRGIAADSLRELLDALRRDEDVRGVLLRVDSPGGDGVASDLVWRSLALLAREKPLVVSLGDVAASGGYYLAAAGHEVIAEPTSVTGSIGVVGGKLDLGGLYDRAGIASDSVERGARAGLLAEARGFTPDERAAVRGVFESLHQTFSDRVASGRRIEPERMRVLATGRVWSGARAAELGLVDRAGGPLEALAALRQRVGLGVGERYLLETHPRRPSLPSLTHLLRQLR